jgi:hypothetical protein
VADGPALDEEHPVANRPNPPSTRDDTTARILIDDRIALPLLVLRLRPIESVCVALQGAVVEQGAASDVPPAFRWECKARRDVITTRTSCRKARAFAFGMT